MNYEELQSLLNQAEAELNKGNYDEVEIMTNNVLTQLDSVFRGEIRDAVLLRAYANNMFGIVSRRRGNSNKALEYFNSVLLLSEEIDDKARRASVLGNIGNVYADLADWSSALEHHGTALSIDEGLGNNEGVARHLSNIGNVYLSLSDYPKALESYGKALSIDDELGNKRGIEMRLGNLGIVHYHLSDYPKALECYGKALSIAEELGNKQGVATSLCNIGNVYRDLADFPKALKFYHEALIIDEELGRNYGVATDLGNIGGVYRIVGDNELALNYLNMALKLSEEIGAARERLHWLLALGQLYSDNKDVSTEDTSAEKYLKMAIEDSTKLGVKNIAQDASEALYRFYKSEERWQEALTMKELSDGVKEEVNIEEAKKQASLTEQRKQAAEREKEIAIAKATADAKHQATEQLLHNVLPPSIAHKMLDGTKLIAEKLSNVSVLFADIVGFTQLSQRISPEELVEGLDAIFSTFDALAEKYGLEKIKTIGDAYMVVSGAPEPREDHAEAMVNFALGMVEAMKDFSSKTTGEQIQLRVGIHCGEVVAGVIGKKKFAYDMWGDAVNTASRMESHGEVGKIHVSSDFVASLSPTLSKGAGENAERQVICFGDDVGVAVVVHRGEMDIKGKGFMQTYFLEKA